MLKIGFSNIIEENCRCNFGGAKMPKPPGPPVPPPDASGAASRVKTKDQAKYRRGRQDTILGGAAGASGQDFGQKTLLGG